MVSQHDLVRIERELDQVLAPQLLAIADWHEENGDANLAQAYRMIVVQQKVPSQPRPGVWRWRAPIGSTEAGSEISINLLAIMQGWRPTIGYEYNESPTLSIAYRLLARAMVELGRA